MNAQRLRAIFREELAAAVRTFPHTRGVRLFIPKRHFEPQSTLTSRDIGWFDYDTRAVYIVQVALKLPEGTLRGVIRHELGHAADQTPTKPGCENRADALSKRATGEPIRYDSNGLQHATRGLPKRPKWLHQ